jgi:hypothetical protein
VSTTIANTRRAGLLEYLPFMARDYGFNQGISTAVVAVLIGVMTMLPAMSQVSGARTAWGSVSFEVAATMLRVLVAPVAFVGVLFATNGIVANDRKFGYYRFLFSKPLSPTLYYGLMFLVHGVGFVAVTLLLMGVWSLLVRPMPPADVVLCVTIIYIAYGGLGFLLSAAWRFDWLSLVTVLLAANAGWSIWGTATGLRRWILHLLPPVHRATDVYAMVANPTAVVPWHSIAWLLGYGVIYFVLGLIVIRRRPLGST